MIKSKLYLDNFSNESNNANPLMFKTPRFHGEEKLNNSNNDNSEQIFIPLHEIGTEDHVSQLIGNNEEFA
jgi:hypothetical protein